MKKFFKNLIICIFIIILCAAAVFFIGWTQLRIKPDSIGVLSSKTSGINEEPILPGKFSWNYDFLLPTNTKLYVFPLKNWRINKKISGKLPSADIYSTIFSGKASFDYNFDFDFSVSLSPENIVELCKNRIISDEDSLKTYMEELCDSVAKKLSLKILEQIETKPLFNPKMLSQEELFSFLDLDTEDDEVIFSSIIINDCTCPDYTLYTAVRNNFLSNIGKYISLEKE